MSDGDDDDTVPTARAGVDPLIAFPKASTGATGQIERPGDHTPWWFIPGMFAVALGFIALLVFISESRSGDLDAATVDSTSVVQSGDGSDDPPRRGTLVSTGPTSAAPTTVDPLVAALPEPGSVFVGNREYDIVARCEVHLPYEPVDTETQISSYFFFDQDGGRALVERIFDGSSETTTRMLAGLRTSSSDVTEIGDDGAFSAEFVGGPVLVNPASTGKAECADRVVTNAPGQFAEPHIQIVLDVCADVGGPNGTTISGVMSQGGGFEILQAGGELAEIVYVRGPDDFFRTSAPATILRTGEQLSASGVVSNGVDDLDITIDIGASTTVADARPCTTSDRL